MTTRSAKAVRCAIYTRVSTDQGLDQDFNSLDAQYDASEAYIRSQAHAGWVLTRSKYDDGGFSGGNTERPALQKLLTDVSAGRIDTIVVYKVDRLTRSLADFAKLVELFDRHGVSFVSVTQQFNTTTSMGRLTLNVLLSFAQFEREVTSERIRDKIAASKRKGLWVGGNVPIGYKLKDGKIVVADQDADTVRMIFQRYLEVGSIHRLMLDFRSKAIRTPLRTLSSGRKRGGVAFTSGPLSYILRNRFYVGEVVYKGETLPGSQSPIIEREVFDAVQRKFAEQKNSTISTRSATGAPLIGLLFDDRGNRMTPSHSRKHGVRYRYYVSMALLQGRPGEKGSTNRVPAVDVETVVAEAVRRDLDLPLGMSHSEIIAAHVERVDVQDDHLAVALKEGHRALGEPDNRDGAKTEPLRVPWTKPPSRRRREVLLPEGSSEARPIRADARARLVEAIARGRCWMAELTSAKGTDAKAIAVREACSVRSVNMAVSLAFLAPDLVQAALEGRLPRGVGLARLYDLPPEWSLQRKALGLAQRA